MPSAQTGRPPLVQRRKIFGALPSSARAYRVRDEAYRSELPADQAEMRITALMIDGRALMPALLIAITKGDALALRRGT